MFLGIRSWRGGMFKLRWTTAATVLDQFGNHLAAYESSHGGKSPENIAELTNWTKEVANTKSTLFKDLASQVVYLGNMTNSTGIVAYLQYSETERWTLSTNGLSKEFTKQASNKGMNGTR